MNDGFRAWWSRYRWLALLLVTYVAARIIVLVQGEIFTAFDSATYAHRADPALDHGPVLSFLGDAPRLWGVPLLYSVFPSDPLRVAAQWSAATVL